METRPWQGGRRGHFPTFLPLPLPLTLKTGDKTPVPLLPAHSSQTSPPAAPSSTLRSSGLRASPACGRWVFIQWPTGLCSRWPLVRTILVPSGHFGCCDWTCPQHLPARSAPARLCSGCWELLFCNSIMTLCMNSEWAQFYSESQCLVPSMQHKSQVCQM